ncbi:MAG: cbb3-type cytochrome c oxidase subunit I [Legionellales bacterium]|nr:cbb3-type cytochrome c oxidase subunit I [Legionellales bacterium]
MNKALNINEALKVDYSPDKITTILKWLLLIVALACFGALIWGTYITYQQAPPLPNSFNTPSNKIILSKENIVAGKSGFQRADLMDYGSLYGMGSYFGEDYTAKYLVKLGQLTQDELAKEQFKQLFSVLSKEQQYVIQQQMQQILQTVKLNTSVAVIPTALANAITTLRAQIIQELLTNNFAAGWTKAYSLNSTSAAQTADFLIYSSLTTVAHRPGENFSYTNNWPYEPSVGNVPTTGTFTWTWVSFCFIFFGFGAILFIFHRYFSESDHTSASAFFTDYQPLTTSQKKVWRYFLLVALVLLVQIGVGAILAHYYSERADFYGINLATILPFNFLRDIHIQTPIVWIGLSWIASALFLAPIISGSEAKGQGLLVDVLFWVTLLIVAGAIIGDYLGIMNIIQTKWFWFGNQGLSYIQLGRAWQIGFAIGLVLWSVMIFRSLWPSLTRLKKATYEFWTGKIHLEHLFWASTINIAVLYWFGMIPLTGVEKSFTITDFWRWWVVHLWVEQSFEFFAVTVIAYLLMGVGLVSRRLAERTVFLEIILIFLGGVLGTGHHWYWVGEPAMWLALGSVFSFIEVLPLLLLIIEATTQHSLIKNLEKFPYRLAYLYIIGSAFWNFVGAGVFGGGTINAPLINYYEHATFLTLNHAHTALFGAFGLLALGMIYFCLRYAAGDNNTWSDRLGLWAFWCYNIGLVLWILLNFFPIGWLQLNAVYEHGLAYARSLAFYNTTLLWQWLRLPGDVVFAAGALLMGYDFIIKLKPFLTQRGIEHGN